MRGQQKGAQERRREGGTREQGTGRKRSLKLLVVRQVEIRTGDRRMRWRFEGRQHSTACYAGAAERGAGEEERRRDEGTGDRAKEVARAAGGKAAGTWVIGG